MSETGTTTTQFYRKRLVATEEGLEIVTDKFVSIHETPCFHFCVPETSLWRFRASVMRNETELQLARRLKLLKRIDKHSSRIAFPTEERALEHLRFLKRRQIKHITREYAFIKKFLAAETLDTAGNGARVPDSRELVHQHYVFD